MDGGRRAIAAHRMRAIRRWETIAALALLALGAFSIGCAIWWGIVARWDMSARIDTPRIIDPSAGSAVIGGFVVGLVLCAAGGWMLIARRRR